jgi:hypothetical protein
MWGAVPPVYDTTRLPMDRGIHVHARREVGAEKVWDETFRSVYVQHQGRFFEVTELDAIYFMASSVFGFAMKEVCCTRCGCSHLDKDWFGVHPHQRHLCSGCGNYFRDTEVGVGNPICGILKQFQRPRQKVKVSPRTLNIQQSEFPGGLQIWGSNQAVLWTGPEAEWEGILFTRLIRLIA